MSKLKKFKLNTLSNYILLFARLALSIIVVPYYLDAFGEDRYGIYLLSFGLTSALSFLDLGAGKSVLRYAAEYHSDRHVTNFSNALSHSVSLYAYGVGIIIILQFVMAFFATSLFNIPLGLHKETTLVFMLSAVYSLLYFIQQIPFNILQGWEIFFSRNVMQLGNLLFNILIVVMLYLFKFGLVTFVVLNVAYQFIMVLSDVYLVKKNGIMKNVELRFLRVDFLFKSEYFKFSRNTFLASSVAVLSQQADKYILSSVLSVKYVTIYTIITKPYFVIKSLLSNVYTVLQPIMVKKYKEKDFEGLKKNMIDFTRITIILIYPVIIISVFALPFFMELWLNSDEYTSYFKWGGLAIANLGILVFSSVFIRLFSLTDHSDIILKMELWGTLLNFTVSILLTYFLGLSGVILGTTLQFLIVFVMIYRVVPKILNIGIGDTLSLDILAFFGCLILLTSGLYFIVYRSPVVMINTWIDFVMVFSVMVLFYLPLQFFFLKRLKLLKYLF